jgi:hypothetical protein
MNCEWLELRCDSRRGSRSQLTDACEQRLKRVARQLTSVISRRRQFAQRDGDFLRCESARLLRSLADKPFCEPRAASHRSHAAACEETHFGEAAIFHASRKLHDVAASGIGHFDPRGCFGQFSRAARILEVIEHRPAEHIRSMPRAQMRRNAAPPQRRAPAIAGRRYEGYRGASAEHDERSTCVRQRHRKSAAPRSKPLFGHSGPRAIGSNFSAGQRDAGCRVER